MSDGVAAPQETKFIVALLAGACAGTSVDVALFPIDTIKTRLQDPRGFAKAGGFKGVYNGLASAAAGSAPGAALFFSTYETVKNALTKKVDSKYHSACYMTASSCGEVAACLVRVPTENVKQKMQAGQYKTTMDCIRGVAREGPGGFYRGYFTTVAREIPFSLIQFPLYEGGKKRWSAYQGYQVSAIQAALCGSAAGGFAAAVTTPLDVVKTRLMLGKDAEGVAYKGTMDTVKRIYAEGGANRFLSGLGPRTMWISIGGCVFFGAYEGAKELLTPIL